MDSYPLITQSQDQITSVDFLDELVFHDREDGTSPLISSIQILVNTAIGSGTLMVPYCYTTGAGNALLISILFCFIGFATLSFFVLSARWTKRYDYKGLFAYTFGENNVWIVQVMIFLVQFGSCMIYCHWIGRLVPKAIGKENSDSLLGKHAFWIFIIALVCVFPLVCLRSIKQLEKMSYLSSVCVMLLVIHSIYWFFKGVSRHTIEVAEKFVWFKWSPILITCMSVNSMAYNCHMNFYPTLEHQKNATYRQAFKLAGWVMGLAFVIYNLFGIFTYLFLFDAIGNGSALEAYTEKNILTTITIFCVVLMMIFSVPIVIWAARTSINDIFWGNEAPMSRWIIMAAFLTAGSAGLAATSDNVIFFFDIVGGLFTPGLIFLIPSLIYLKNQRGEPFYRILVASLICVFTVIATVSCTYQAIMEIVNASNA